MASSGQPPLDPEVLAELHNRLAGRIVREIVEQPIAAGGTISNVMTLCESILVGVMLSCLQIGADVKILDAIVGRVKERLARARLTNVDIVGEG